MEVVAGKGAHPCACRRPNLRKKLIAAMPEKIKRDGVPSVGTLEPRRGLHPMPEISDLIFQKQRNFIRDLRAKPLKNLFLAGDNGCGKTHIAYAAALASFDAGHTVIACDLADLLEDFRRFVTAPREELGLNMPRITADALNRADKKYTLLIDEADKPNASEFRSEMLFHLLNAAANFSHRVIAVSNKDTRRFIAHWSRCDESYGNSIARRMAEGAIGFECFWL